MSKTLCFLSDLLEAQTQNVSGLDIAASALDSLRVPWQKLIAWAESNESITASHTPNQIPVFLFSFCAETFQRTRLLVNIIKCWHKYVHMYPTIIERTVFIGSKQFWSLFHPCHSLTWVTDVAETWLIVWLLKMLTQKTCWCCSASTIVC